MIAFLFAAALAAMPKIDIVYPPFGTIYDRGCAKQELIAEAGKLRSSLQSEWDAEGPKYFSVVSREAGLPFPYREMQAYLSVCDVSTMSMPLIINVRSFLPSSKEHPPEGDFSEKLFHELMHHYVAPVHNASALRAKYANEHAVVLNHLHVMALEKLALTRLGKTEELKYLDWEYRTDPPPAHYKRAWEIVNDIEGYRAFIKELQGAARTNP